MMFSVMMLIGLMAEAIPSTIRMLNTLEPMALPSCHIDFIFSGCNDGSHKLRKRCTDGNDGKSDQRLRHSKVACDSGCSIDSEIPTEGDRSSTADNENNAERYGDQLDLFIGTALNLYFFSFFICL